MNIMVGLQWRYLYIYKILTSKVSLLLTVLVSLTIVFLCMAEAYHAKKRYQRKTDGSSMQRNI